MIHPDETIVDHVYMSAIGIGSVLSILGAGSTIFTYIGFEDLRTTTRRIVMYISIGNIITAAAFLSGITFHKLHMYDAQIFHSRLAGCQLTSALLVFSEISSFLWTAVLALYIYLCIVKGLVKHAERVTGALHFICWPVPAVIAAISIARGVFGEDRDGLHGFCSFSDSIICWVKHRGNLAEEIAWQLLTWKGWEISTITFISIIFFITWRYVKKEMYREEEATFPAEAKAVVRQNVSRLTAIPITYTCLHIWGTISWSLYIYSSKNIVTSKNQDVCNARAFFMIMGGLGASLEGFANCILFCLSSEKIRARMVYWFLNDFWLARLVERFRNRNRTGLYRTSKSRMTLHRAFSSANSLVMSQSNADDDSHLEDTPLLTTY